MDMNPDYNEEGDLPAKFADKTIAEPTNENIEAGKAIFVGNCAFCHGYGGNGDGPSAAGLHAGCPELRGDLDVRRLDAGRLLLARERVAADARDAAVAHVVRRPSRSRSSRAT